MNRKFSRRDLIQTVPGMCLATGTMFGLPTAGAFAASPTNNSPALWPGFPRQDAKLVAEIVGKSHFDEARVRELVKSQPALVNAWWDWGFGDWESPLGAASHVGRRNIAEFLLDHGARIDIFAAAMLGMTDVVKAFVTAQPGIQRTHGPHGIPLLAHAKVGGKQAADTVAYLESLGDAGNRTPVATLPDDRKEAVIGKYVSDETDVRLECKLNRNSQLVLDLKFGNVESTSRNLNYSGHDEFYPSGVPSVRFCFAIENGSAKSVTIRVNEPILTAKRVGV